MNGMKKVVYVDDGTTKAVVGDIYNEDNFFVSLKADKTGVDFRIGKQYIISIKEVL